LTQTFQTSFVVVVEGGPTEKVGDETVTGRNVLFNVGTRPPFLFLLRFVVGGREGGKEGGENSVKHHHLFVVAKKLFHSRCRI